MRYVYLLVRRSQMNRGGTTRAARQGEHDGVDYKFLTVDEFLSLEKSGGLLESGIYNGNYYGTPKPQVPVHRRGKPYTGQSSSSSCQVEQSGGTLEEQKQGLSISNGSSTIQDGKEEEEDQSLSAVGSASQKPLSDWKTASVGNGMTDDVSSSVPLDNRLHHNHSFGQTSLLTQLPYGWEKVIDPDYGVYYIDHINRKTQYDFPLALSGSAVDAVAGSTEEVENMKENNLDKENRNSSSGAVRPACNRVCCLTRNNIELKGEFIRTQLMKSSRGLGFTIVSADDSDVELLQIKTILPNGSADIDGRLQQGDVLVYVDSHCVVGFTHQNVITLFQSIPIGRKVTLEVCRGYPLPFDTDDPSTEVITTVAVTLPANRNCCVAPAAQSASGAVDTGTGHLPPMLMPPPPPPSSCAHSLPQQQQQQVSPPLGAEKASKVRSRDGEKRNDSGSSVVGLAELSAVVVKGCDGFGFTIADSSVGQKIQQVLDRNRCHSLSEADLITEINGLNVKNMAHADVVELLKNCPTDTEAVFVIQRREQSLRRRRQSSRTRPSKEDSASTPIINSVPAEAESWNEHGRRNSGSLLCLSQTSDMETNKIIPFLPHSHLFQSIRKSCQKEQSCDSAVGKQTKRTPAAAAAVSDGNALLANQCISGTPDFVTASAFHNPLEDLKRDSVSDHHLTSDQKCNTLGAPHVRSSFAVGSSKKRIPFSGDPGCVGCKVEFGDLLTNEAMQIRNFINPTTGTAEFPSGAVVSSVGHSTRMQDGVRWTVQLERHASGFGIRIVGGIEEGSQVAIGYIVPGGAADAEGHLEVGDEILAVNQQSVIGASHHQVVSLMSQSALLGFVILDVWKRESSSPQKTIGSSQQTNNLLYVTLTRKDGEGFGFVIVSSVSKAGSIVGKILDGSPAGRCQQLQVGDSILAINSVDIGNMPHQEVVNFIKASGLSIVLTVAPVSRSVSENRSGQMPHTQTEFFHLIRLQRGLRGFGFSIRGGKEFDGMPLYILKIADDGPAENDGRLQIGDEIIEINGCSMVDILHTEAIDIIQNSGSSLSLLIKRSSNNQHITTHEHSLPIPSEALTQNSESMLRSAGKESQKQTKAKKLNIECQSKNSSST